MSKNRSVFYYFIVSILLSKLACASSSIDSDMNQIFNNLGVQSNITPGGAYKDQSGGYYTGGRIYMRTPSKNTEIANIQMPGYRAGCGGIDIFAGGLSYVSGAEIVSSLKNIASNAQGYAFNLAMQTITPQIYSTMTELQSWAQRINNMNINSCETAALAVGGLWPKSDAASNYLCNTMSASSGAASDWVKSRHSCGADGKRYEQNKGASANEKFKDQLGDEFNLAWKAIRKNAFLANNQSLAEFFMSISGSIVSRINGSTEQASMQRVHLASLANDQDLIDMLMYGAANNARIYKCDNPKIDDCLYTSTQTLTISKDRALVNKVESILRSIAQKRIEDTGKLTEEEMGLINISSLPIFKIIGVQAAFKEGNSSIAVSEYSEAIAYDLLLQYLESILDLVSKSLSELAKVQIDDNVISEFKTDIARVRKQIMENRNGAFQQLMTTLNVVGVTKLQEAQMQHAYTNQINGDE